MNYSKNKKPNEKIGFRNNSTNSSFKNNNSDSSISNNLNNLNLINSNINASNNAQTPGFLKRSSLNSTATIVGKISLAKRDTGIKVSNFSYLNR